ncbi:MAG TPA: hypothetical protein VGO78_03665 [Acidimicrobiales bacterium]|jgi:hypothetical protein|nr:hypothetical protein [Acidimicrobiales bacterium]
MEAEPVGAAGELGDGRVAARVARGTQFLVDLALVRVCPAASTVLLDMIHPPLTPASPSR